MNFASLQELFGLENAEMLAGVHWSLAPPGRLRAEFRYRRAVYGEQSTEEDIA